jgi:hypothetical protein
VYNEKEDDCCVIIIWDTGDRCLFTYLLILRSSCLPISMSIGDAQLFGALPHVMLGGSWRCLYIEILPVLRKSVYVSDGTNREILEVMDTSHESLPGDNKSQLY